MRLPASRLQKLMFAAVLCALALALSFIDSALSSPIPFLPGFKLGLANIVSLFALYTLGLPFSLMICAARALLAALLSGAVTMLPFSLPGGMVSVFVMYALHRRVGTIKISVAGGAAHNCTQTLAAFLLTGTPQVAGYLPVLIAMGAVSGFCMGLLCKYVMISTSTQARTRFPHR